MATLYNGKNKIIHLLIHTSIGNASHSLTQGAAAVPVGLSTVISPSTRTLPGQDSIHFSPVACVGYGESFGILPNMDELCSKMASALGAVVFVFVPVQCGSGALHGSPPQSTPGSQVNKQHTTSSSVFATLCRQLKVYGALIDVSVWIAGPDISCYALLVSLYIMTLLRC